MAQPRRRSRPCRRSSTARCARFDRALLHAVDHAEGRHQFAGRMHRDLELAARHGLDLLANTSAAAVDGVQRLGEAGGQAPADGGLRVHGRRDAGGQHAGDAGMLDEGTTIHGTPLVMNCGDNKVSTAILGITTLWYSGVFPCGCQEIFSIAAPLASADDLQARRAARHEVGEALPHRGLDARRIQPLQRQQLGRIAVRMNSSRSPVAAAACRPAACSASPTALPAPPMMAPSSTVTSASCVPPPQQQLGVQRLGPAHVHHRQASRRSAACSAG
jgi:hypothetical protein